jgi:hypothetical protein
MTEEQAVKELQQVLDKFQQYKDQQCNISVVLETKESITYYVTVDSKLVCSKIY